MTSSYKQDSKNTPGPDFLVYKHHFKRWNNNIAN